MPSKTLPIMVSSKVPEIQYPVMLQPSTAPSAEKGFEFVCPICQTTTFSVAGSG